MIDDPEEPYRSSHDGTGPALDFIENLMVWGITGFAFAALVALCALAWWMVY